MLGLVFSHIAHLPAATEPVEAEESTRGLHFPEINTILRWKDLFPTFNKIALIACAAALIGIVVYLLASRKDPMKAPKGTRNIAEIGVEFIEEQVVMPTMGKSGLGWTPFLLSLFIFIYLCNAPGIIPFIQMPATARMAIPLVLSLLVWVVFIGTGVKHNGLGGYAKSVLFPPGVPKALYILVTPIEFISTIIVRPFSLTVRLFANMLAGHILLVTFALLSEAMFKAETMQPILNVMGILPLFMLIFLTLFELLVAFLQAYIFVILAAVYIGGATHPEH
ncbi:F0F1 ATP synthase subunit A [Desertimonas flava]|uniref:F0F1 ATP synthase subunit A n=1 Tax=Desertimonas flava TaxID=2064846 RepID=UPI001D0BFA0A|nr:F0F1 ATP synthase subunit A [Desertimonas flava]